MLYFGSFNPIHKGHIALAEYIIDAGLADMVTLIVSPQSPYKQDADLAGEMERFEMAEKACAASRHPEKIQASSIEFILPRPSYTIDTLRFLNGECGGRMEFSILMGADQIEALDGWKEYEKVLEYPVYVYPRRDCSVERFKERIRLLEDAPLHDFSATDVRRARQAGDDISAMVTADVARYIYEKELWSPEKRMAWLDEAIAANPADRALREERGRLRFRRNMWGEALNDFNAMLRKDASNTVAREYADMIHEILTFRYKDIYNP